VAPVSGGAATRSNHRCIIPASGYYEWHGADFAGITLCPYALTIRISLHKRFWRRHNNGFLVRPRKGVSGERAGSRGPCPVTIRQPSGRHPRSYSAARRSPLHLLTVSAATVAHPARKNSANIFAAISLAISAASATPHGPVFARRWSIRRRSSL